ncbi:MAG: hypothetical protein U0235_31280 [Polyangiaceae bacterium]
MSQVAEQAFREGAGLESGVQVAASANPVFGARDAEFVGEHQRAHAITDAEARGDGVVQLASLSPLSRGRLFEAVEQACDRALESLGAPPPGLGAFGSDEARVKDWVFRARRAGRAGLTLLLPSLQPLVGAHRALATDDSDALALFVRVGRDRPLTLLLERAIASSVRSAIPYRSRPCSHRQRLRRARPSCRSWPK